jgi:hypothetical protein
MPELLLLIVFGCFIHGIALACIVGTVVADKYRRIEFKTDPRKLLYPTASTIIAHSPDEQAK